MMVIDKKNGLGAIDNFLFKNISIYPLVSFRFFWGILVALSTYRFMDMGWVDSHYVNPILHFHYPGFDWVEPLSREWMYIIHFALILFALFVAIGFLYRFSSVLVFVLFTYTELIDLTYYLNHYYFISIVSLFMVFLPANRFLSLDVLFGFITPRHKIHSWTTNSLKVLVGIVYVYAGLAKINYDWLILAMPLKLWLPAKDALPIIGPLFRYEWTAFFFSWCGMFFDTFIVLFLLMRKTRLFAFLIAVIFHLMTALLFQIGMFPFVMILSILVFFSSEFHKSIWQFVFPGLFKSINKGRATLKNKILIKYSIIFFLSFHLLFPWRYLLHEGDLFWKERGYRYSWRVMLMEKSGSADFYLQSSPLGKKRKIENKDFLNTHQEKQMSTQGDLIYQYLLYLEDFYKKEGLESPIITSQIYITLNGRPSQLLFDKQQDLLELIRNGTFYTSMNPSPRH